MRTSNQRMALAWIRHLIAQTSVPADLRFGARRPKRFVKLNPRADVEFAVDAAEVDFDGFGADEQRGGDVAVGQAGHGEFGDALFGWGQSEHAASAGGPSGEFGAGALGPQCGAELFEDVLCLAQGGGGGI